MAAPGRHRLLTARAILTWRLWRALRFPDESHPLFQRVRGQPIRFPGLPLLTRFPLPVSGLLRAALVVFILITLMILVSIDFSNLGTPALLFIPLAVLALVSNGYAALVAFNVMNTISRERDHYTYDLLAVTPTGLGAANWLIASACAYRLNAVERMAQLRTLAVLIILLLSFASFGESIFAPLTMLALLVAFNLDDIQTLIIGCLSGMLAQEFREQGAPFAALAIFAFAQIIVVYLPVTGIAILLFDALRRVVADTWLANSLIALLVLALLFGLREALIRGMWRALERRLL